MHVQNESSVRTGSVFDDPDGIVTAENFSSTESSRLLTLGKSSNLLLEVVKVHRGHFMKGQTGSASQTVRIYSNSYRATNKRQKTLNKVFNVGGSGIVGRKMLEAGQHTEGMKRINWAREKSVAANNLDRAVDLEVCHTLVRGTVPVRHQMMTRTLAFKLNQFNRKNGLKLLWMQGKQKL